MPSASPPVFASLPQGGRLAANIMHFARVLREAGMAVGPSAVLDALDAVAAGPLHSREDFYWTLHAVFVKRREQREIFDQAFHFFWRNPRMLERLLKLFMANVAGFGPERKDTAAARRVAQALGDLNRPESGKKQAEIQEIQSSLTASAQEVLRAKDFEQMTAAEQAEAKKALAKFRLSLNERRIRRFKPDSHGARIDLRRTMRDSIRSGGDITAFARRRLRTRIPPLVVLCDVSGSCEAYSRMFLHFLHALANDRMRIHVFLFGTRLTHVTRDLQRRDVDEALARVSSHVKDWAGGTRLGAALHEFNFKWARRVLGQGADVLLMTDGLERGDLAELETEMKRLRRSARAITWASPLLRYVGFEPLAGGIQAIMPHVTSFRPAHNLDSIEDLARSLAGPRKPEHDPRYWLEKQNEHA